MDSGGPRTWAQSDAGAACGGYDPCPTGVGAGCVSRPSEAFKQQGFAAAECNARDSAGLRILFGVWEQSVINVWQAIQNHTAYEASLSIVLSLFVPWQ